MSTAGDVNGDGVDDLLIGTRFALVTSGASYVVFGGAGWGAVATSTSRPSTAPTASGSRASRPVTSRASRSTAGDVNGDGVDDLLIGAPGADANGDFSGASYVVFGGAGVGNGGNLELSALDGTNGFKLSGVAYDASGFAVSTAGDVNGDGLDDLLIGAPGSDQNGGFGVSYVVFGQATPVSVTCNGASFSVS